jgi:hypothetical protein
VTVANGQSCLLWDDLWNGEVRKLQFPELYSYAKNKTISLSKAQSVAIFHELFNLPVSVEAFTQMQELEFELLNLEPSDLYDTWTYIWGSPIFSASKAYKHLIGHSNADPIFKLLWKTSCQGKHKIFFWLILRDKLSTRNMIRRRGMFLEDYHCVLCQQSIEETVMHLFFYCPFARDCWAIINFSFADHLSVSQIFQAWKRKLLVDFSLDIFIIWCWAIWLVRNDVIFRNRNPSVQECKRYVTVEALLLLHRTKTRITPLLESWISSHL